MTYERTLSKIYSMEDEQEILKCFRRKLYLLASQFAGYEWCEYSRTLATDTDMERAIFLMSIHRHLLAIEAELY